MKNRRSLSILAAACFMIFTATLYAAPEETPSPTPEESEEEDSLSGMLDTGGILSGDFNNDPTYIKSNSLALKSTERLFIYKGKVEVKHGLMVLTSDLLEGVYDENNQIKTLTAKDNVIITKGKGVRATSGKALYDSTAESVTLSESPELMQKGSILTADTITIFLKEDRSTATGEVRVKVIKTEEEEEEDEG